MGMKAWTMLAKKSDIVEVDSRTVLQLSTPSDGNLRKKTQQLENLIHL